VRRSKLLPHGGHLNFATLPRKASRALYKHEYAHCKVISPCKGHSMKVAPLLFAAWCAASFAAAISPAMGAEEKIALCHAGLNHAHKLRRTHQDSARIQNARL
jgi:hypothetical protein